MCTHPVIEIRHPREQGGVTVRTRTYLFTMTKTEEKCMEFSTGVVHRTGLLM